MEACITIGRRVLRKVAVVTHGAQTRQPVTLRPGQPHKSLINNHLHLINTDLYTVCGKMFVSEGQVCVTSRRKTEGVILTRKMTIEDEKNKMARESDC